MTKNLKLILFLAAFIYLICVISPFIFGKEYEETPDNSSANTTVTNGFLDNYNFGDINQTANTETEKKTNTDANVNSGRDSFIIKDTSTDQIIEVSVRDFLISTLGLEMSPLAPSEALKAQAVAAYTFYSRSKELSQTDYDFTYDSEGPYVYTDTDYLKSKWGENADQYLTSLGEIVDEVAGEYLVYNNELACTAYFAMSNGVTQSALDVWGQDIPYLTNVASPYDVLSPTYETFTEHSPDEVKEILEKTWSNASFDFDLSYDQWFTEIEYGLGGTVLSTNICGFSVTGNEVRSAFLLRSTTYKIAYDEEKEKFIFSTKGYGHGVGMSQTGAMTMADNGADYQSILNWYYPGTELITTNS